MSLKQMRQEKDLSQSELSRISGISIKNIQAYEQGVKNLNCARPHTLLKLSIVLQCKIQNIISDQDLKNLLNKYERMHENVK